MEKHPEMAVNDQREMAELQRSIGALTASLNDLKDQTRQHQQSSDDGRRRLYEKMEAVEDSMGQDMRVMTGTLSGLTTRVDRLSMDLEDMKPTVTKVKSEHLKREGARELGKAIWLIAGTVGGAMFTFLGFLIHESAMMYLKLPPHP